MKRDQWIPAAVVLGCIGVVALFLLKLQKTQRLGEPGVKVIAQPIYNEKGGLVGTNSIYLPAEVEGFASTNLAIMDVEANWLPKDTTYGRRWYGRRFASDEPPFECQATVVMMGTDRTSIHKPEFCLVGNGWPVEHSEVVTVPMREPHPYDLKVMKLTTATRELKDTSGKTWKRRAVYAYWFVADEQLTPLHGERMWWMARDMVRTGVLSRWAYISYFSLAAPGKEEETFARMKDLMAATVPRFQLTPGQGSAPSAQAAMAVMAGSSPAAEAR